MEMRFKIQPAPVPADSLSHINNLALSCKSRREDDLINRLTSTLLSGSSSACVKVDESFSILCFNSGTVQMQPEPTVFYLCCHFPVGKIKRISAERGSHSKCQEALHTLVSLQKGERKSVCGLQGEAVNFPEASQPPPVALRERLAERLCSALIFSHTSRHSHKKTSLGLWGLSITPKKKSPARIWNEDEDIGDL